MKTVGWPETPFERRVETLLAAVPGWAGRPVRYALAAAPVASPTHRATASDCLRVAVAGEPDLFVKVRHPDMVADLSPVATEAAARAGGLGLGPAVRFARDGMLAFDYLPEPWRYARVGDLQDRGNLAAVLTAVRRFQEGEPFGHRVCPFARVSALAAEARNVGAPLPEGTDGLLAAVDLIGEAVRAAGVDLRPCRNSGLASDVMIGPGGVRLVDFDQAGDADPWFEVGAVINENCRFEPARWAAIEAYAGSCTPSILARCRLYGVVDDALWGLWGVVRSITCRRGGIEFFKYGQWRLFHARTGLADRDFEAWLRSL